MFESMTLTAVWAGISLFLGYNIFNTQNSVLKLVYTIILSYTIAQWMPFEALQYIYTVSFLIKELLSFALPFIVFIFVSAGILSFKKNAPLILAVLLSYIFLSNMATAFFTYFISLKIVPYILTDLSAVNIIQQDLITPLYTLPLSAPLRTEQMMLAAFIIGIFLSIFSFPKADAFFIQLKNKTALFLNTLFIPLLPIYILGFVSKMHYEGNMYTLFSSYGKAFILIIVLQWIVIPALFFIAAGFSMRRAWEYIQNALPAYLTAFSSMSSTATLPVSIPAAQKNGVHKSLAEVAMPILANIHLLGDCITTPILALVTLGIFTGSLPSIEVFTVFILNFSVYMLAAAGIPGGGIIAMYPILQSILGFSPDMLSIITTLYILQDGIGTAGNVTGDIAVLVIIQKILKRLRIL
jgi:Na+/H+-dicarboxylate symporter